MFHTDSTVTQAIINKGRFKKPYVNSLLRNVPWECAKITSRISAVHVAGSMSIMVDTVSHLHEGKINELVQLLSCYHRRRQPVIEWNQHMSSPDDRVASPYHFSLRLFTEVRSSYGPMAKTILQGTVQGGRRRGRQRKRWEDNIKE